MATYTHFEATPPQGPAGAELWSAVIDSVYSVTPSTITIANSDGTVTHAHGSFAIINNTLWGGFITSLDRTSGDGSVVYESITGTLISSTSFVAAATGEQKLGLALAGADNMTGYSGNDYLNGYGGADHMAGGAGNDRYVVDSVWDVVTELPNQGSDFVYTTLSNYTLPANVEGLVFTDSGSHIGTGNNLDNALNGSSGQDTLYGLGGNDSFHSWGGGDTFVGGTGNDFYYVTAGDTVVEQANEGIDRVETSMSNYILPANVENLQLDGKAGPLAFGNSLDNNIVINGGTAITVYAGDGNDEVYSSQGDDTLLGQAGDDKLFASIGHDILTGGTGDDTFVISSGKHVITDFEGAGVHDRIDLAEFKPVDYNFGLTSQVGQNIFHSFSDVMAHTTQQGADTVIDLGAGNSLTLQNIQKASLTANDFIWTQTPKDFKGDTVSDILWHSDSGQWSAWNNASAGGAQALGTVINPAWHMAGSGDFDGNGTADLLWRNDNGAVTIWDDGLGTHSRSVALIGTVSSSWHIAGIGDFDGNGKDDVLVRNNSGQVTIWAGGDPNHGQMVLAPGILSDTWHFVETGDFDGNGRDDILLRNDNGQVTIWDNGNPYPGHVISSPGILSDQWHFVGTGDFDGNGKDDILLQHDSGQVTVWNNGDPNQAVVIAKAGDVGPSWHIAGVGDYDGNRQSDILWHSDTGSVSIWDNGQMAGMHGVANGVDPSWHIV